MLELWFRIWIDAPAGAALRQPAASTTVASG